MRFLNCALAVCVITLATGAAHAQTMKPGLWQVTRTPTSGADTARAEAFRKRLANATPEERKRFEAVMTASGQSLGAQPGQIVGRACITPKQAAALDFTPSDGQGCKRQALEKNGSTVHVKTRCDDGTTVDFVVTFQGDTAYDGKVTMALASEPAPRSMKLAGKWLAATCDPSAM